MPCVFRKYIEERRLGFVGLVPPSQRGRMSQLQEPRLPGGSRDVKAPALEANGRRTQQQHPLEKAAQNLSICGDEDLGLVALKANLPTLQRDTVL